MKLCTTCNELYNARVWDRCTTCNSPPRRKTERLMRPFSIALTDSQYDYVVAQVGTRGENQSQVIRNCISQAMAADKETR